MKTLKTCVAIAAFAFGIAGIANATTGVKPAPSAKTAPVLGAHTMAATVTGVDHRSGMVDVDSYGMHLAVHFPPPAIKSLKVGEKIVLHLGYSVAH